MRSGGRIPPFVALCASTESTPYGGSGYNMIAYPIASGRRTVVRPVYNDFDRQAAMQAGHDTVDMVANTPISGLRLIGQEWLRRELLYNIIDDCGRVFRVDSHVVIDSAVHESVSGGLINGSFIWCHMPYLGMALVRVGSEAYKSVLESHTVKSAKSIPQSGLVPGDVLQTKSFKTSIYLGQFNTKYHSNKSYELPLQLSDERVRVFYHPASWHLKYRKSAIESVALYEDDLMTWLNGAGHLGIGYRFGFNLSGFKRKAGSITLPCHMDRVLSTAGRNILRDHVNGNIRDRAANSSYDRFRDARMLSEACRIAHLSEISCAPELNPLYDLRFL